MSTPYLLTSRANQVESVKKPPNLSSDSLVIFSLLFENFGLKIDQFALVVFSHIDGRILEVNSKFCELSGYSKTNLIGNNYRNLNFKLQSDCSLSVEEIENKIKTKGIWHNEIRGCKNSGEFYWAYCLIAPIKDHNGQITCYKSISLDITGRKQKELSLRQKLRTKIFLQAIYKTIENEKSVSSLCRKIIKYVRLAAQYPQDTVCKIELDGAVFYSKNYSEILAYKYSSPVKTDTEICGQIAVGYLKNQNASCPKEQKFINAVANCLASWVRRRNWKKYITHIAFHDPLTGLPNRRLLLDRIEQALAHSDRQKSMIAILLVDLDHFKVINDTFGHQTGDQLLKKVSERILSCIRNEDTAARYGGDEFVVVLPHISESENVLFVAQKLLYALKIPYNIEGKEFHIGCSIGIAISPKDGKDYETLLRNSDTAMYSAKIKGGCNYHFYSYDG